MNTTTVSLMSALLSMLLSTATTAQQHKAAPYHDSPSHVLNRVFDAMQFATVTPVRVGLAIESEHDDARAFYVLRWVHATRPGSDADRGRYGGDERQLVREGFDEVEEAKLRTLLDTLDDEARKELHETPELAIYFQHDLLRMAQRLADTKRNAELIPRLLEAAKWAALPAEYFHREVARFDALHAILAKSEGRHVAKKEQFSEVLRKSTRLFDASRTLLWSRVWLAHPGEGAALRALIDTARDGKSVEAPIGLEAILAQGIVAIDDHGEPHATKVVIDLRHQRLANRDALSVDNATTSHDGVDFGIWFLSREALRKGGIDAFATVEQDKATIFRDYGSLKRTTYRAQCTLCHRTTDTPEPHLGGFPLLRAHAKPQVA
ncbi:MAG: hypothetical protein KDC95_21840, partial [Planctomycetes bacterium]|nr:hypothetical protein [Planctomycetota bacterium]